MNVPYLEQDSETDRRDDQALNDKVIVQTHTHTHARAQMHTHTDLNLYHSTIIMTT